MQVARTAAGGSARGPYGPFELLQVAGYDGAEGGDLYFAAVQPNPRDARTLLGLFPVAFASGDAAICIAFSCDSVHWSELRVVMHSQLRAAGRINDHPVLNAVVAEDDGSVRFHVQHDVPEISPVWRARSRIVAHTIDAESFEAMLQEAKLTLGAAKGCLM